MSTNNLGRATAYGYAKSKGYTGTEEQFAQLMADFAGAANTAVEAAEEAEGYKNAAAGSATSASTYAGNALGYRDDASASAQLATSSAQSAEQAAADARAYKGSPMAAATKAAMTDTSRVYVYTGSETGMTAGHWYYYNGSAWADGGVYNSVAVQTDTTLSVQGAAADAAAVGKVKYNMGYKYVVDLTDASLYENGSIEYGEDDTYRASSRIRTPILYAGHDLTIVNLPTYPDAKLFASLFDFKGTYIGRIPTSGWASRISIPQGTAFRLLLAKNPSSATAATVTDTLSAFTFYSTPKTESDYIKATIYANGGYYYSATRWSSAGVKENAFDMRITGEGAKFLRIYYDHNGNVANYIDAWVTDAIIPKDTPYKLILTVDDTDVYTLEETLSHFAFDIAIPQFYRLDYRVDNESILDYFEHGSLNNGANDTYHADARARTISILSCEKDLYIKYISGQYTVDFYDDSGNYTEETGWLQKDRIIPANTKFRLLVTEDPLETALTDIAEILEGIRIHTIDQKHTTFNLNPNIIYLCRSVDDSAFPPESKWYVQAAARNQYDRVRFTFRRTTDGYWFNCHDTTINNIARNMDGSAIETSIPAEGQTLATLNQYDWGIKYGKKYAGAKVPMLEECLKYAAIYNLGVTLHYSRSLDAVGDEYIDEIIEMADKYGILDNAMVLSGDSKSITKLQRFKEHNPRTSFFVGGEESWFTSENIESIKTLQTPFNKIYVELYPWGTTPTSSFIAFAKQNNFILFDSITMNRSMLLDEEMFSKGYGVREVANVYMIKDTIREWADSLVDGTDDQST